MAYATENIEKAESIIATAKRHTVADGQALYLVGEEVVLDNDGCQPSNSMCLAVGPTDDEDWDVLEHAVLNHLEGRYQD